jgi:hypothetical protein
MSVTKNPGYMKHEPDLKIGNAVVRLRHAFWLGSGRAALFFDENKRLVSIDQARFAYRDRGTGRTVVDSTSWDGITISRNDFRAHYPGTRGEWSDPVFYRVEGPIAECLALTAWFRQSDGYDQLVDLAYHYTCPTESQAQK